MSAVNYSTIYTTPGIAGLVSVFAASVSTNSTLTLSTFTTITTVTVMRQDTFAIVTATISGNVVTITQAALTNVNVVIMVGGNR